MIRTDYLSTMAHYNAWQNRSHLEQADTITDEARRKDRGAFFGSIHATMSHLLWGDRMWMRRFDNLDPPKATSPADGALEFQDWDDLKAARAAMDIAISDWAGRETQDRLDSDLSWYSGVLQRELSQPMGRLVVHFFNHQTHHRGQIHSMLTSAGCRPIDTDLFLMPDEA